MYCSQSKDGQGDFASIAIKDGRVEFRFDTGSGPAILRSGVPINAGEWYTILVERKLREGKLEVQDKSKVLRFIIPLKPSGDIGNDLIFRYLIN